MKTWRNDKIGLLFGEFARIVIRDAASGGGKCHLIRDAKKSSTDLGLSGDPIGRAMFARARGSDGMLAIMQRDLMSDPTPLLLLLLPLLQSHIVKPPVRPARRARPSQGHESCFLCLSMLSF